MEEGYQPRNEKDRYNYDLCEFFAPRSFFFSFLFLEKREGGV